MPRPKKTIERVRRTVYIPETLDRKVELLLMDPSKGKAKYGAWSDLTTALLRKWVDEQIRARTAPEGESNGTQ
jgi:hypothetical protein